MVARGNEIFEWSSVCPAIPFHLNYCLLFGCANFETWIEYAKFDNIDCFLYDLHFLSLVILFCCILAVRSFFSLGGFHFITNLVTSFLVINQSRNLPKK